MWKSKNKTVFIYFKDRNNIIKYFVTMERHFHLPN